MLRRAEWAARVSRGRRSGWHRVSMSGRGHGRFARRRQRDAGARGY